GQQQRVALARSLVVEPDILLLDEPLSNLDAKLRERMRTELKELQRRTGITFVYVTHDQAEALALSDQIAVMNAGRVQQVGTPFDVYAHPANRMVADFMGLVNLVPGRVKSVANGRASVVAGGVTLDLASPLDLTADQNVDVAIRPENIRLKPINGAASARAKVTGHVFLGNISEYYVTLPRAQADGQSGAQVLRVQTHPMQRLNVGADVAIEIDAAQCSVFRRDRKDKELKDECAGFRSDPWRGALDKQGQRRPAVHVRKICRRSRQDRRNDPVRARLVHGRNSDLRP